MIKEAFYKERYARYKDRVEHVYVFEPSDGPMQFQRFEAKNEAGETVYQYRIQHSKGTVNLVDVDSINILEGNAERTIIVNDRSNGNNHFIDLRLEGRVVDFSETYHKDIAGMAKPQLPKGLCEVKNIDPKLTSKK